MRRQEFWIVAGPNGAGKTTFLQVEPIFSLLPSVSFINPDDIALQLLKSRGRRGFADATGTEIVEAYRGAANLSLDELTRKLRSGESAGVETVLSSDKYHPAVEFVLSRGGFVGLIYVWLNSPELALERVASRVAEGGHDVPHDRIIARWERSLVQLRWFAERASNFWVFDNSDSNPETPPELLANGGEGRVFFLSPNADSRLQQTLSRLSAS